MRARRWDRLKGLVLPWAASHQGWVSVAVNKGSKNQYCFLCNPDFFHWTGENNFPEIGNVLQLLWDQGLPALLSIYLALIKQHDAKLVKTLANLKCFSSLLKHTRRERKKRKNKGGMGNAIADITRGFSISWPLTTCKHCARSQAHSGEPNGSSFGGYLFYFTTGIWSNICITQPYTYWSHPPLFWRYLHVRNISNILRDYCFKKRWYNITCCIWMYIVKATIRISRPDSHRSLR